MKQIPLSQGKFALVDDVDYDFLMQWKWCVSVSGYAVRRPRTGKGASKLNLNLIYLHKEISKVPNGMDTDHINCDRLDNRRVNLRHATRHQNLMNRKKTRGTSQFKGVSWDKEREKWFAKIRINGKQVPLGRYDCEYAAASVYNAAAVKYFGEFAWLNNLKEAS